jgi:tRNA pseudouridine38-40 synthase
VWRTISQYRVSSDSLQQLSQVLKGYEGTFNYHNFTSQKDSSEANANRHIMSIDILGSPFIDSKHGTEWILISIVGQSFLLNQVCNRM